MSIPLHCTAIGKALLSGLPREAALETLGRTGQSRRTANTLTSLEALTADLDATQERGWSLDDEENEVGVVCVGAAVRDATGRATAAVSVSQLLSDVTDMPPEVAGPLVASTAREVSRSIGGA
jgi:DNA-binding IclR family transcriptional regulator